MSPPQFAGAKFLSVREVESLFYVPCIFMFYSIEKLLTKLANVKKSLSIPYLAFSVDVYKWCTDVLFCTCQTMTFGGNLAPSSGLYNLKSYSEPFVISQSSMSVECYPLVKEIVTQNTKHTIEMPLPPLILEEFYIPSC